MSLAAPIAYVRGGLLSPMDGPCSGSGLPRSPRWYPESGKRTLRTLLAHDARASTDMRRREPFGRLRSMLSHRA